MAGVKLENYRKPSAEVISPRYQYEMAGQFISVEPIADEVVDNRHRASPGTFGYNLKWDGDTAKLEWKWDGGDVAVMPDVMVERLKQLCFYDLVPWGIDLLAHDEKRKVWYVERRKDAAADTKGE